MDSCKLVNLVSVLACFISENYTDEQITVLAALFTQLGDTLATILANNELIETNKDENCSPSSSN